jgi:thiamine biosynthesis lipoprotein
MQISYSFDAIGTHWKIDIENSRTPHENLLEEIINRCVLFDKTYSRFRDDSLVIKMSKEKGTYRMPDDSLTFFSLYENLYNLTDHKFTPLIGSVLTQAGYDQNYSLEQNTLRSPALWQDALKYSYPYITLQNAALLDFGAAGKGYLIDIIGEILKKHNIHTFTIDGGGDILYKNKKKEMLRVGLEHPDNPQQVIGIAKIRNQSICCSAGNRRKWKNFHHIINPHTLTSPMHVRSAWVIAKKAILADAIATCLFFVPAEKLLKKYHFTYALINEDYSLDASPDFPAEFFLTKNKPGVSF